jgi:uncharacterized protein
MRRCAARCKLPLHAVHLPKHMVPDYDELTNILEAAGINMSAAEAHGILTGACCVPTPASPERLFFGRGATPIEPEVRDLLVTLADLQSAVQQRLAGVDFDFEPLLDSSASGAVASLGDWARGFVFGLTASGVDYLASLSGEAGEFVQDAISIGEVEAGADGDGEAEARDIAEIVEYLRVGTQVVYEELHASSS